MKTTIRAKLNQLWNHVFKALGKLNLIKFKNCIIIEKKNLVAIDFFLTLASRKRDMYISVIEIHINMYYVIKL